MKMAELCGREICDRETLISRMREELWPGEEMGNNLDALYDRLTEASEEIMISIRDVCSMLPEDLLYRECFLRMLRDARRENPEHICLVVEGEIMTDDGTDTD